MGGFCLKVSVCNCTLFCREEKMTYHKSRASNAISKSNLSHPKVYFKYYFTFMIWLSNKSDQTTLFIVNFDWATDIFVRHSQKK